MVCEACPRFMSLVCPQLYSLQGKRRPLAIYKNNFQLTSRTRKNLCILFNHTLVFSLRSNVPFFSDITSYRNPARFVFIPP